jgi:hypothetical protein
MDDLSDYQLLKIICLFMVLKHVSFCRFNKFEFLSSTVGRWHELDSVALNGREDGHMMSGKGFGRKRSWPKSRFCPSICLVDLDADLGLVD